VTGVVVIIAIALRRPIALLMILMVEATLVASRICRRRSTRLAFGLLRVGEACGRVARGMLRPRS
jgi:hypothetical protein